MRNIFGQKKSAIDFFDLTNSNKIFIANLSKGEIGEMNCNLAGSLIITQFYLAALKRITLPPETWMLYPLYVDEMDMLQILLVIWYQGGRLPSLVSIAVPIRIIYRIQHA
jgi:hypothetical protein